MNMRKIGFVGVKINNPYTNLLRLLRSSNVKCDNIEYDLFGIYYQSNYDGNLYVLLYTVFGCDIILKNINFNDLNNYSDIIELTAIKSDDISLILSDNIVNIISDIILNNNDNNFINNIEFFMTADNHVTIFDKLSNICGHDITDLIFDCSKIKIHYNNNSDIKIIDVLLYKTLINNLSLWFYKLNSYNDYQLLTNNIDRSKIWQSILLIDNIITQLSSNICTLNINNLIKVYRLLNILVGNDDIVDYSINTTSRIYLINEDNNIHFDDLVITQSMPNLSVVNRIDLNRILKYTHINPNKYDLLRKKVLIELSYKEN